jgi:hypothetical protein
MADLRPLGSEKLPLDDKIRRIMEIARYNEAPKKQTTNTTNTTHLVKESVDGFYGVVKEKDGYYVKFGLTENTLDYIGGLKMKNKNRFNSYAEAYKRMELIAKPLNEQEKKFVLDKPSVDEDPDAAPSMNDAPPAADAAPSDDDVDSDVPADDDAAPTDDAPPVGDEGGEDVQGVNPDAPEHMKAIQKLTGKLGQRLRQHEDELKSDDYKYVINSILSAIDLSKLDDSDKEEIASRFEDSEYDNSEPLDSVDDTGDFGDVGGDDEDVPADTEGGDEDYGSDDEDVPPPSDDDQEMGEGFYFDFDDDIEPSGDEEIDTDWDVPNRKKKKEEGNEKKKETEDYDDIYENFQRLQRILKG